MGPGFIFSINLCHHVLYPGGRHHCRGGGVFAGQFIGLYTRNIGEWSKYIITIAAITTMFSTVLTCLDAFPRVLKNAFALAFPKLEKKEKEKNTQWMYWGWMIVVAGGAVILLSVLSKGMTFMVDLATTLSFLTAPILAVINYKVVTGKHMPSEAVPPKWLNVLSWAGFVFLIGFSLVFLYFRFLK